MVLRYRKCFSKKGIRNNNDFCFKRPITKPDHFRLVFTCLPVPALVVLMVSMKYLDELFIELVTRPSRGQIQYGCILVASYQTFEVWVNFINSESVRHCFEKPNYHLVAST